MGRTPSTGGNQATAGGQGEEKRGSGAKVVPHPRANDRPAKTGKPSGGENQAPLPGMLAPVRSGTKPPGGPVIVDQDGKLLSDSGTALEPDDSPLILPGWNPEFRGVPNGLLRSALFAAIRPARGNQRVNFKNETMASVDGLTLIYTGEQLHQGDLDVYLGELHFSMTHGIPLGKAVLHSECAFLRSLGRGTGRKEYERLRESLLRMVGGVIQVKHGHYYYAGSLINHLYRDEKLNMTGPVFNPELLALFQDGGFSGLYWQHRLALGDSPLAQWLHGHYSSHKQPFDYSVAKLHELCGSETKALRQFRFNLKEALSKTSEITGWQCGIVAGDKVHVDRTGGSAEALLVAKKPGKSRKKEKGGGHE